METINNTPQDIETDVSNDTTPEVSAPDAVQILAQYNIVIDPSDSRSPQEILGSFGYLSAMSTSEN